MADVDNFKTFNDRYGHIKGDTALRQIAYVLQSKSRKIDTVARYGGEEFAIVMPNTSKENARLFSERLRNEVEKLFAGDASVEAEMRLTISCVLAAFPDDVSTKDDLIAKADLALYEAKRAGKNRTCVYESAMGDKKEGTF